MIFLRVQTLAAAGAEQLEFVTRRRHRTAPASTTGTASSAGSNRGDSAAGRAIGLLSAMHHASGIVTHLQLVRRRCVVGETHVKRLDGIGLRLAPRAVALIGGAIGLHDIVFVKL